MAIEMQTIQWSQLASDAQQELFRRPVFDQPGLADSVSDILRQVRNGGDAALLELTRRFDGVTPAVLEAPASQWRDAASRV